MFLYDADQTYEYDGVTSKYGKHIPPRLEVDKIDLTKYKKTLRSKKKPCPITLVDNVGQKINPELIPSIKQIIFTSNKSPVWMNFIESHFDASLLDNTHLNNSFLDDNTSSSSM